MTPTMTESMTRARRGGLDLDHCAEMMGGTVGVHLRAVEGVPASRSQAEHDARSTLRRLQVWADRLTRFSDTSDLARLNASPASVVPISPTLAAVLDWARQAESLE